METAKSPGSSPTISPNEIKAILSVVRPLVDCGAVQQSSFQKLTELIKSPRPDASPSGTSMKRGLSYRQAADLIGCSIPTLVKMVKAGKLHPVTFTPRTIRFDSQEVESMLAGGGR